MVGNARIGLLVLLVSSGPAAAQDVSLELFARPALAGLAAAADLRFGARLGTLSEGEDFTGSRFTFPPAVGVGARVSRGSFGLEGSWTAFRSTDLVPLALASRDRAPEGLEFDRDNVEYATAQLVFGQAFWKRGELSIGAGAGVLLVSDPETDRLLGGGFLADNPLPGISSRLEAQQRPLVVGASAGFGFRFGSLVLRPRLDALYVRPLWLEYEFAVPLPISEAPSVGVFLRDEIRPFLFLVGVDIGFRVP